MKDHVHIIVEGLVQGVGFRWFVARTASELHLTGFVRNCPDGTVEIAASGETGLLHELMKQVRVGPRSARVTNLRVDWNTSEPSGDPAGRFEIR